MGKIDDRLAQLGIALPTPAAPVANYVGFVRTGNLVFTGTEDDPATLATLSGLGYGDAPKVAATIRGWHHGRYRAMRSVRARELLTELLRDVSRSFYLTLRVLPRPVRPQIGLAYLLARATDTIADTATGAARIGTRAGAPARRVVRRACRPGAVAREVLHAGRGTRRPVHLAVHTRAGVRRHRCAAARRRVP